MTMDKSRQQFEEWFKKECNKKIITKILYYCYMAHYSMYGKHHARVWRLNCQSHLLQMKLGAMTKI